MKPPDARTRAGRLRRRCGFDGNALRRRVDRIQWRVGLLLLLLFLVAAPVACSHVVSSVHAAGVRAERYEAATRHRVDATVVGVTPLESGREVSVAWTGTDGATHTGRYTSWRATAVGQHRVLWTGPRHNLGEMGPRTRARTVGDDVSAATAVVAGTGLPLLTVYLVFRWSCDRRRYRQWDEEWADFDRRSRST
ncbi:Rv1733c family protein [Spirillospora sp. CA-108201]